MWRILVTTASRTETRHVYCASLMYGPLELVVQESHCFRASISTPEYSMC